MDLPEVTVQICTYNRPVELVKTIAALAEYLIYPPDRLNLLICDDHTPDYLSKIAQYLPDFHPINPYGWWPLADHILSTPINSGWAANVNHGLGQITSPFIFFLEDDRVLTEPLDLVNGVTLLMTAPNVGMVRYGGTAGNNFIYSQREADVSELMPDYRDGLGLPGRMSYLQIEDYSEALWIYSNQPHLKARRFHGYYGLYPEGRKLGETEEAFAHIVKDVIWQDTAPKIAVLPEWVVVKFDHIGQSYQHTEFDR